MVKASPRQHRSPLEWALAYHGLGFQIVPCVEPVLGEQGSGKRPDLPAWRSMQLSQHPIAWVREQWADRDSFQMGLLTGRCSDNVNVIDLDTIKKPQSLAWWTRLVEEHGDVQTVEQVTGSGGAQKLFRFPPDIIVPTFLTNLGVDCRGQGGFAVLPPSRHFTGGKYRWREGLSPWEIEIAMAPQWLIDAISRLHAEHGGDRQRKSSDAFAGDGAQVRNEQGRIVDGRDAFMRDVVWSGVCSMYEDFGGREPTPEEDADRAEEAWRLFDRAVAPQAIEEGESREQALVREGRGRKALDAKWRYARGQWNGKVAEAVRNGGGAGASGTPQDEADEDHSIDRYLQRLREASRSVWVSQPVKRTRSVWREKASDHFDVAQLERPTITPWLERGKLTLIGGMPGSSKSLLLMLTGIAVATGHGRVIGATVERGGRAILLLTEDGAEENRRRMQAIGAQQSLGRRDLEGVELMNSVGPVSFVTRGPRGTGDLELTPKGRDVLEDLIEAAAEGDVALVGFDPLAALTGSTDENSAQMHDLADLFNRIAQAMGAAVMIPHHLSKVGAAAEDADMYALRGSTALAGAAKIIGMMRRPSKAEKTKRMMSDSEAKSFRILQMLKHAAAPDSQAEEGLWFRMRSVPVLGRTPDGGRILVETPYLKPDQAPAARFSLLDAYLAIEQAIIEHGGKLPANAQAKPTNVIQSLMAAAGCNQAAADGLWKALLAGKHACEVKMSSYRHRHPIGHVKLLSPPRGPGDEEGPPL